MPSREHSWKKKRPSAKRKKNTNGNLPDLKQKRMGEKKLLRMPPRERNGMTSKPPKQAVLRLRKRSSLRNTKQRSARLRARSARQLRSAPVVAPPRLPH